MAAREAHTTPFALLRTKLHRPQFRQDLVPRPRLVERLDEGLDRKLTLVSAPAGSGKTTLLAQWLAESDHPVAWLSLDENDNDLTLFLSYVIAAIQTVFPEACPETSSLTRAPQLPPGRVLVTALVNEIAELPESLVLCLDDYHYIGDAEVHQFIAALIENLPPQMHLVLATRRNPPLPLMRLRVNRQMLGIRMDDLRFTLAETQAFLKGATATKLSDEVVALMEDRTEGWIAGLRLAALAMRDNADYAGFVRRFRGTHRDLVDYLVAEVLSRQSEPLQDFLVRSAILDRFGSSLCDAVLEISGSQAMIEELDRGNLLIVPLDDERGWFRYHHLFRDLLRHRLRALMGEQDIALMHHRAGVWYASKGLIDDALRHALEGGDIVTAAHLVEADRFGALNRGGWRGLDRRLKRLPEEIVSRRPALLVASAWARLHQFRLRDIDSLLEQAESRLDRVETELSKLQERTLRGEIAALHSYTARIVHDDVQRSFECAERALEQLPLEFEMGRGLALAFLGMAYQAMGSKNAATRRLHDGVSDPNRHAAYRNQASIALAYVQALSGDLRDLEQTSALFLDQATKAENTSNIGWARHWRGQVRYEWNELEAAAQHFSAVSELGHRASFITLNTSMLGLARVHLALGKADRARETLAELRTFAMQVTRSASSPDIDAFQALLALTEGDVASALDWARSVDSDKLHEPFSNLYPPSLARDRMLIAEGSRASTQEALDHLQRALTAAEARHNTRRVIQVLAHLALAYDAGGHNREALDALERAIVLARPGRFIRTFLDLGPPMARLLSLLAGTGLEPAYLKRLLTAFGESVPVGNLEAQPTAGSDPARSVRLASQQRLLEPLTQREADTLVLLARGHTNREIAETLSISPHTVKRHTSGIYQKLDVNRREQAVAKARALGLFPLIDD